MNKLQSIPQVDFFSYYRRMLTNNVATPDRLENKSLKAVTQHNLLLSQA